MKLGGIAVVLLLLVVLEASLARKHLTKEALQEKKHATHRRAISQRSLSQYLGNARRDYCGTTHHRSTREKKCDWEVHECDDPAIRDLYTNAPEATFRIMYNVIRDDNGKDPLPPNQIVQQEIAKLKSQLKEWFNLNADFKLRYVDSNALRYSYTNDDCTFSNVGNGECDKGCNLKEFGYDGGDCNTPEEVVNGCDKDTLVGNGKCDGACNYKDFEWDGGECCSEDVVLPQCKEPGKKNVYNPAFNEPGQFRKAVYEATTQSGPARPDISLNLYPNVFMASLLGIATFPNEPTAVRPEGGYLSVLKTLGDQEKETSIHELGHCIGLLHTFAGTTEQVNEEDSYCKVDATCIENVNGANRDNLGDFCSDTPAEPKSFACTEFDDVSEDCTGTPFPLGDTHNYMSYQSECGSEKYFFTAQQKARARCYLDRSPIKAWIGAWSDIDIAGPASFPPAPAAFSPSPTPSPSPSPAPSGWTCDPKFYGAKDGCDCECGVYDPDCDLITQARVPEIFNCDSGFLPKCDKTTAKCVYRKVVPNEWQCDPMAYDTLDGCDCDCGTFDPDCNVNKTAAELFNCNPGGVCSATGTCQYPVPPTWICNPLQYNDGVTCNCNCGALDTDCDYVETAPPTVGCIGTERCHLNDGTCVAAQDRFEFGEGIVQTTVPKLSSYSFVADDSVCESFVCDLEPSLATRTNVAFLSSRPGCPGTLVDVFSLDIVDYENGLFRGPSMGTIVTTNCDPTLLGNEMLCGLNEVTGLWTPVNTATCTPSVPTAARAATLKTGTCAQFNICQPFKYYGIFRSVGFSIPRIFRAKK